MQDATWLSIELRRVESLDNCSQSTGQRLDSVGSGRVASLTIVDIVERYVCARFQLDRIVCRACIL